MVAKVLPQNVPEVLLGDRRSKDGQNKRCDGPIFILTTLGGTTEHCELLSRLYTCDWVCATEADEHIIRRVVDASIWFVEFAGCLGGKSGK